MNESLSSLHLSSKINPLFKLEEAANSAINFLKDKKVVMLGESSHGTEEYYKVRRLITEKLIKDHGFNFVAVEGDWPECYAMNQYIKSDVKEKLGLKVLSNFKRWPMLQLRFNGTQRSRMCSAKNKKQTENSRRQ